MEAQVDQMQKVREIVDIILRRKAMILFFIFVATAVGLAFYLSKPKVYESTSLLIYQSQKVNPSQMSPDDEARIQDVVSTLSQIVISRNSLEKIIKELGLYAELRQTLPMEDIIVSMRKRIQITPSRRGNTFTVRYEGGDPEKVAKVTNSLAARFIEENLKLRQERATETSDYTQDELDMAKGMLDTKEAIMRDYKLKYYNEMPDQRDTNMARLIALQEQYQSRQESIQDIEKTRVLIRDQIEARRQVLKGQASNLAMVTAVGEQPVQNVMSDFDTLQRMQNHLLSLQGRYTDQHPKVKSLKKKIARLEKKLGAEEEEMVSGETSEKRKLVDIPDNVLFELNLQLKDIAFNIKKINKEKEEIKKSIDAYEKWVSATPIREAEWSSLTREYGELKRHYDFLVAQNLQAGSALNLERKQKGSQFKIEDPAREPTKPTKPDFLRIMLMALAVGGGLGGGLALGLDFLDTSFRDPLALEGAFGIPVICSVPTVSLKKEIVKARIWTALGVIVFCLAGGAIILAVLYFWKNGQIIV